MHFMAANVNPDELQHKEKRAVCPEFGDLGISHMRHQPAPTSLPILITLKLTVSETLRACVRHEK